MPDAGYQQNREVAFLRLRDKVALITGAGSGIGKASARLFAKEGAKLVIVDVDQANGKQVADDLNASGSEACFVAANVSLAEDAQNAINRAVERFGQLDILFNNAGVSSVGDVAETSPEEWDRVFAVNVRGVYLMSHFAVKVMESQDHGVIINMSSCIANLGLERRAAYAASKGAVLSLTRAMAADHSRHGIRVAALLPGTVYTPFVEGYLRQHYAENMDAAIANLKARQLNNELMMPEDVASAALFLASDEARFALGTAMVIDGGVTAAKVF